MLTAEASEFIFGHKGAGTPQARPGDSRGLLAGLPEGRLAEVLRLGILLGAAGAATGEAEAKLGEEAEGGDLGGVNEGGGGHFRDAELRSEHRGCLGA